jgi:hypothetical protein
MALTKEPRKILSSLNVVKQAFEMLQRFRFQQEVTWLWVAWSGTRASCQGRYRTNTSTLLNDNGSILKRTVELCLLLLRFGGSLAPS